MDFAQLIGVTILSACYMAHPKRANFIDELREQLDLPVIWDEKNDRWETGARALMSYDPAATHHLVIQDDAILSRDLLGAAEKVAEAAGEHPVGLYTGNVRPSQHIVSPAVTRAQEEDASFIEMEGPWWGVAIIIPTPHIKALVTWGNKYPHIQNYDKRISRWYRGETDLKCWYTMPSLVDHRGIDENPSLIKGRTSDRKAQNFIGEEKSGLDIDWTGPPLDLKTTFKHKRSGKTVRVYIGGQNYKRFAHNASAWEQLDKREPAAA